MRRKILLISLLFLFTLYFTINAYGFSTEIGIKFDNPGTLKFSQDSYAGLYSVAKITVADQDLNLRAGYIDTAKVKITSGSDPKGFIVTAYETGANTGEFSCIIRFSIYSSDSSRGIIKISGSDSINASYIDEVNSEGRSSTTVTAAAGIVFSEAVIQTSADNDSGTGNMLDISISDPDENNPDIKDIIIAKASSGSSTDEMTLRLEETGVNTGTFSYKLYFTEKDSRGQSLNLSGSDKVNIKYVDHTVPQAASTEIVKTINWNYQSTVLELDKEVYTGYNSSAIVTLTNMDLNKYSNKVDYVNVEVTTGNSRTIDLQLKETKYNSGSFVGTLYFDRSLHSGKGRIKVTGNDTITVTYRSRKNKTDTFECSAEWYPADGLITLDRQEYSGENSPVEITLKDQDLSEDPGVKDSVRVIARLHGNKNGIHVTLTETGRESDTFTGTFYINGGKASTLALDSGDKLEVVYADEDTASGITEYRTAYAVWTGISKAELTLDKNVYTGYGANMTISLNDPDQNKRITTRDKVEVSIKTKSGKTNMKYTLTETGSNTGIFTGSLVFTEKSPAWGKICVADKDEIIVIFADKEATINAIFEK